MPTAQKPDALPADLEALMPEPAFQLRWHSVRARYTVSKPNIGDTAVFTADQVREAMLAATERAATVCEQVREPSRSGSEMPKTFQDARWICAAAIRSGGEAGS